MAGENVGTYAITQGTLAVVGGNYTISFTAGVTFAITPATLTVTPTAGQSKTYGAANPAYAYGVTGLQFSDTAARVLTGALTRAVGENVGTYAISQGTLAVVGGNYTISFTTGVTFAITPATLTITPDSGQSKLYLEPDPVLTYAVAGLQFSDSAASVLTGVLGRAPGEIVGTYAITQGTLAVVGGNYVIAFVATKTFAILPRAALVNYIGQRSFVTSGASATTAQVTLTASMQDPTGATLARATVDFIDPSTGSFLAKGVKVSTVPGSPAHTGTANTIVTLSTGQYGAEAYIILVKLTGNYDNTNQSVIDKTATVVVSKPTGTNESIGAGTIAALSTAAGSHRSNNGSAATFSVGLKYNKSQTNLQGKITLVIPQSDGVVYMKSNSLSSMAITGAADKTSIIYSKSSLSKVLTDGTVIAIEGAVTLRMDIVDFGAGGALNDEVGFTVLSSKSSELFYSNRWQLDATNTWKTIPQKLATGAVDIN